jgi:hypothetical protein
VWSLVGNALAAEEDAARRRVLLPAADTLDKVMRYESHLGRQLTQTLHLLERLQAARSGNPPVPPAALDVTIDAGPGGTVLLSGGDPRHRDTPRIGGPSEVGAMHDTSPDPPTDAG